MWASPRTNFARAAFTAFVCVAPRLARAEPENGKALAEQLFLDGRALVNEGRLEEACTKFAMSQRIEKKLGTLLNLATCNEALGKTASAWAEFTEAATLAARSSQPDRVAFAREHVESLRARLSRVQVASKDPSAERLSLQIDGVAVEIEAVGTAFPLDPGARVVVASAPGKKPWTLRIDVPIGPSLTRVEVPALADSAPERRPEPLVNVSERPSSSRIGLWAAFGTSAVAIGVGTYFGLHAFAQKRDADARCNGAACSQTGLDLHASADLSANVSSVAFGAALVAAGVGVYLLFHESRAAAVLQKGMIATW